MKRVLIIGCPGSGKSTAARRLAQIVMLPVIHMDFHYWQPGWKRPEKRDWEQTIKDLASGPEWVMDGNYAGTLEHRLARADTVIHLDFSTFVCSWRMLLRTIKGYGQNRKHEFVDGCLERLDLSFLWFVLNYRRTRRKRDMDKLSGFEGRIYSFNEPIELEKFLRNLESQKK